MKPMEIIFYKTDGKCYLKMFYTDGTYKLFIIEAIPDGIVLRRHYSITDLYGYGVIDDRKDL